MRSIADRGGEGEKSSHFEVIGQVTGGVAHDFNNLLMIIGGNLELLKDRRGDRDQVIDWIEQAIARGESLTRQLLSFSRRQAVQPQVLDLAALTPKLVELLRPSLRSDIDLLAEVVDDAIWSVEADPGELELALLNLAVNACDAMPRGGRITLSVQNQRLNGQAVDGLSVDFVRIAITATPVSAFRQIFFPRCLNHSLRPRRSVKGPVWGCHRFTASPSRPVAQRWWRVPKGQERRSPCFCLDAGGAADARIGE